MNATVQDYSDIIATVEKYVAGCNAGSGDVMKPAFHEATTINGAPIQTLFAGADEAGPLNRPRASMCLTSSTTLPACA